MIFFLTKGVDMSVAEYKIVKERVENAAKIVKQKEKAINTYRQCDLGKQGCVCRYTDSLPSYGEWEYSVEIEIDKHCPEFDKVCGCSKKTCPMYPKYQEYQTAKRIYDEELKSIYNFPLLALVNPPRMI